MEIHCAPRILKMQFRKFQNDFQTRVKWMTLQKRKHCPVIYTCPKMILFFPASLRPGRQYRSKACHQNWRWHHVWLLRWFGHVGHSGHRSVLHQDEDQDGGIGVARLCARSAPGLRLHERQESRGSNCKADRTRPNRLQPVVQNELEHASQAFHRNELWQRGQEDQPVHLLSDVSRRPLWEDQFHIFLSLRVRGKNMKRTSLPLKKILILTKTLLSF